MGPVSPTLRTRPSAHGDVVELLAPKLGLMPEDGAEKLPLPLELVLVLGGEKALILLLRLTLLMEPTLLRAALKVAADADTEPGPVPVLVPMPVPVFGTVGDAGNDNDLFPVPVEFDWETDCSTWPCLLATTLPRTPIPPMASGKGNDCEMRRSQFSMLLDTTIDKPAVSGVNVDDVS